MRFIRNVRPAGRHLPVKGVRQHEAMSNRGLLALFFGLVALMTLGALVLLSMVDVGADVFLAVIAAVTPP